MYIAQCSHHGVICLLEMPRLQAVSPSPTPFFAFVSFPAYSLGYEDIYKDYYCGAGHLAGGVLSADFLRCPLYGGLCAGLKGQR